jgi:hypothetical protein
MIITVIPAGKLMRSRVMFLFAILIACTSLAAADVPTIALSGDWVLDLKHSRGVEALLRPNYRIDPGIGWPSGTGPNGSPTKGLVGISLLREGGPDLGLQIVQAADEFQVTRKFTVAGKEQRVIQRFDLNGSQNRNPASSGQGDFVSISTWENGEIVNWGTITYRHSSITVKEEYRISRDGNKLTIVRSGFYGMPPSSPVRNSQKPDLTDTLVFKRK